MNDAHYAVVVGINRYPGLGDLDGARTDAERFALWLQDPSGGAISPENVHKICLSEAEEAALANPRGARPTSDEVDYALQDINDAMRAKLEADPNVWDRGRLYLYVAGHGLAPQGGEGALFLANAESEALERNLELADYRRWCTNCALFREVVVFADCCRLRYRSAARGFGPRMTDCPGPWHGKASQYLIGYGATVGRPTYEGVQDADNLARGYFTTALLDGLSGGAARNEVGAITASSLRDFVKTVVEKSTADQRFPQEAQLALTEEMEFGAIQPPPQRTITLRLPARMSKARVVKDGREIEVWNGVDKPWQIKLADGLYEVDADGTALKNDGLFKVAGEDRDVEL